MQYYAHSGENQDKSDWQTLEDHLQGVAALAEGFASEFGAGEWGRLAGLLHDAGKATPAFQQRLEGHPRRVDHSTCGARLAFENSEPFGVLLSYVIAGHHGGLPDSGMQEAQLHYRLKHGDVPSQDPSWTVPCDWKELVPPFRLQARDPAGFSLAFFTRMLFSCLVDADFLDTEAFCLPDKGAARAKTKRTDLAALKDKIDIHMQQLAGQVAPTPVNLLRQRVLSQCRAKAETAPRFFSLTVPTGGGKTLSSLVFALNHAVANNQRRIIYAIPFTSIIEQNARVFQEILGRDQVLEHHCHFRENDQADEAASNRRRGLAAENWDAPVVVTTNVQFFESLFGNKPSRCRKLHNIANSVIVLDEAQAIPTDYLEPCLAALRELVVRYGCSVVLCSATQPAFDADVVRSRLPEISEIVDDPRRLYEGLRRTRTEFVGQLTDANLAARIGAERQVLCIVSTKRQARTLFELLGRREGVYHLSTNMYPEHRRGVLDEIRAQLDRNGPCQVVSTTLVEAGVDLDFPVVYRAMAGLDSIAQAAGRCNREGRRDIGQVFVYEPEQTPRMPWMKRCASRAAETLRVVPDAEPTGLEVMRRYFELLYDVEDLDKKKILERFPSFRQLKTPADFCFPFRAVAGDFRFIEDDSVGVIIPVEPEVEKWVRELRYAEFPRSVLRKLQPYTVSVRTREFAELRSSGALELIDEQFPVLRNLAAYREGVGLCREDSEIWDAGTLVQ